MGLGKTVQAVTLDLARRAKQPNLVKNPKTLVVTFLGIFSGWQEHFSLWAPSLRVCTIDNKNREPFLKSIANDSADVYIVHWQALRLIENELGAITWFHIIADECHALQNRKSRQTVALKALKTCYKTGLSGTPAYDKPDDLWSILNWLYPDYWSSYWKYYNHHIIFTDFDGYRTIVGVAHADELQKQMSGFYIRRRKEDVLLDLPDKYTTRIEVDLTYQQAKAYESMRKNMLAWVGEHEDEPIAAPIVVAQLCRLQQFSDAYGRIDPDSGKMLLSDPSSKLDAVMQIIDSTVEPIVVFSQFSQVIKLLGARLQKAGISHGLFIGDTSAEERSNIIENFQNGKLKVFAGTIAAGGVGITLTTSSTVVFVDRSWSPSQNRQAEDRLHRIGQKNAVQVIDIVSRGTIDAKRHEEIDLKWSWIRKLLGEDDDD
jgi:SNF2 family DNA or RNA helicase